MSRKIGDKDIWVRTFDVTEPRKHKKGFTVYKVVSTVFPRSFPEGATKIKVWKRYNDFKKLHKELELVFRQLYLKGEFPKFPKDKVFGRFEEGLIDERRKCALALLEFAAKYPLLFANKIFVKFFESSYSPQDFADDEQPINNNSSSHQVAGNGDDDQECGPCLIPERVWEPSQPPVESEEKENDPDHHSVSSFTCSSPDVALNNDTDGVLNSSLQSAIGETSVQPSLGSSEQPNITTFSDPSQQGATASHSVLSTFVPSTYTLQESRRNFSMVSSASFTDDFDLLLDEYGDSEDPHNSRITNSVSCLSLDTMPLNKTLRDFKDADANSQSTKIEKKKPNGFGFFDFLPIFAKKQESKVENEKVLAESLTAAYICEAAGYFAVANHYESNSDYDSAFESYKEGIQTLLTGAQNDNDHKRRLMVRKKIENYLSKAEILKEKSRRGNGSESDGQIMSPNLSSPKEKLQDLINRESSYDDGFVVLEKNVMPSFIEELNVYKVVGCTFNNILVVVDTTAIGGPRCYAVKVFRKSAFTLDPEKPTLIPFTVPFMVQMIKWFNTEDSIILVLQYAGGGRLINFVKAYQTKHISPVIHEASPKADRVGGCFTFDNHFVSTLECSSTFMDNFKLGAKEPVVDMESMSISNLESEKENKRDSETETNETEKKDCWSSSVGIDQSKTFLDCTSVNVLKAGSTDPGVLNGVAKEEIGQATCSMLKKQEDETIIFSKEISSKNLETKELIENSKVLIQAVSRTLDKQKEKSQEEQEVKYLSRPHAPLKSMSESNPVLEIASSSPKNGLTSEITIENVKASTKPSNLVLSFSRHLQDSVYNVPTCSSFSNNSDINETCDDESSPFKRMVPECCIKVWAAEIVIALEKLHNQGITYGDLDINNILLGESGHILLSYRALWNEVDKLPTWNEFSAPEVCALFGKSLWRVHSSADWWSLGAILFLLITGQTLQDVHPEGIYPQTVINIPLTNSSGELITPSARTLLTELLQFSPTHRLGCYGAEEIKSHPFFEGFDFDAALTAITESKSLN